MKIRTDYVTNSSSSNFTLEICFELNNGKTIAFKGDGGTGENGGTEFFDYDAVSTVSPRQLGMAKDVEELILLLINGVIDEDEWEDVHYKIFENPDSSAYKFIKRIKKRIKSIEDIKRITITGNEINIGREYYRCYTYDLKSREYYGVQKGQPFSYIGGTHAGDIRIQDLGSCRIEKE